jgi:hypothetical protein
MKIKLFMVVLLMVGLSACSDKSNEVGIALAKKSKNYVVILGPNASSNKVKIKTKAQGWKNDGKKDGYVGYAAKESGWTYFAVKKEEIDDSCAGSAKWVITQLRLSASGDESSEKGDAFGNKQPAWLQQAFPNVKLADGSLFKADDKMEGVTFLPAYNANYQLGEKFIYYEVTLSECDGEAVLTIDPGWGNGGRN